MANELQVARAVADTALSAKGVHSLGMGTFAEVATYGLGEKVLGVLVTEEKVEVHIVALYPPPQSSIPELAEELRAKLAPDTEGRTIEVVVEDLELTESKESDDGEGSENADL